jgi:hypothetical protein
MEQVVQQEQADLLEQVASSGLTGYIRFQELSTSGTNGKEGFDGTSGTTGTSGSSGSSSITKSETPIGIIDGVNKIFTLLEIPPTSSSYSNSKWCYTI